MGLFRRNKKSKIHSGSLPTNASRWSDTSSRQEHGGTKTNIHDGSPIIPTTDSSGNLVKRETTKGSGSLPKPAREELEEYESKYVARKPAKKKETSSSCSNCEKPLKPTAKFCGKCGTPIAYNT
jgi:hypothetical protein